MANLPTRNKAAELTAIGCAMMVVAIPMMFTMSGSLIVHICGVIVLLSAVVLFGAAIGIQRQNK